MTKFLLPKNGKRDKITVETKKELGRGGYGFVYEIVFNRKPAALKVVDKKNLSNIDLLQKEMDIINEINDLYPKCKSKNVLCYYDISEDEKYIYFIYFSFFLEKFQFLHLPHCFGFSINPPNDPSASPKKEKLQALEINRSCGHLAPNVARDMVPQHRAHRQRAAKVEKGL